MTPKTNVLGVGVSAVNMGSAIATIHEWIDRRDKQYVCVTGVHGVMESQRSSELRRIHNDAGMVTPDGMPLVWLLKAAGHDGADRVCGPELMPALLAAGERRGDRHFLFGASETTLRLLERRIRDLTPGAQIVGTHSPPYRQATREENDAMVGMINASGADIVWIGLSTPKQERWMAANRASLKAAVLIGVGAAFDIHAGVIERAPSFMRRTGFEWFYRFIREPRRLWRRYLSNNPTFVALIMAQKVGLYRPLM